MAVTDLMLDGINLLLLGMGTVFVFLALLVGAMSLMSRLAARLSPEPQPVPPTAPIPQPKGAGGDDEVIAVISAAISRYRSGQK